MHQELKQNDFVLCKSDFYEESDIFNFGIVSQTPSSNLVSVVYSDTDETFNTFETDIKYLKKLNSHDVAKHLAQISVHYKSHPFFIIYLNNNKELSRFHIEENDYIKEVRENLKMII